MHILSAERRVSYTSQNIVNKKICRGSCGSNLTHCQTNGKTHGDYTIKGVVKLHEIATKNCRL